MAGRTLPVLLVSFVVAGCATAGAGATFATADTNADERISREEFSTYMANRNAFNAYDANNDGVLSPDEYRQAVGFSLQGDAFFRGFDRDHSGDLTEEEFINGIFDSYDRDGDGWLDQNQFVSVVQGLPTQQ